jgi:uncharacterized protein (TIGR02145 family)
MSTIPCKQIITIYPLKVTLNRVKKASGVNKKDGVIYLNTTGGLPPYKIFIDNSLVVRDPIFNLQPKEYNIKVVDTANEVANLTVEVGYETSPTYCSRFIVEQSLLGNPATNCDIMCTGTTQPLIVYARGSEIKKDIILYRIPNGDTNCQNGVTNINNWTGDTRLRIKYNNVCYSVSQNGLITGSTICGDVKIGSQYWDSGNLKVNKFRNGQELQYIANFDDFIKYKGKPAYTSYDFGESWQLNGYLYNYAAVIDARNLAPTGYRIPTKSDYDTLFNQVSIDGSLKSKSGWDSPNIGAENKFNYNAKAPGFFQNSFKTINQKGNYWTSTNHPVGDGRKYIVSFSYDSENVSYGTNFISVYDEFYPIRLIKE